MANLKRHRPQPRRRQRRQKGGPVNERRREAHVGTQDFSRTCGGRLVATIFLLAPSRHILLQLPPRRKANTNRTIRTSLTCDLTPPPYPLSLSTPPAELSQLAADSGPASTSGTLARLSRQPLAAPRGWGWCGAWLSPSGTTPLATGRRDGGMHVGFG